MSDNAFCSVLFFLLFAPFHIFEELYKKSSWNQVCFITQNAATQLNIFTVQSSKFEKFPSYKEAKSTKKMGKCSNSKMFWIISHHVLTVGSFIIYHFIISPQNRKLPSCIGLLMRNRDKSSFAVNQVCLSTFRVQWRFHIFQVILISTQSTKLG